MNSWTWERQPSVQLESDRVRQLGDFISQMRFGNYHNSYVRFPSFRQRAWELEKRLRGRNGDIAVIMKNTNDGGGKIAAGRINGSELLFNYASDEILLPVGEKCFNLPDGQKPATMRDVDFTIPQDYFTKRMTPDGGPPSCAILIGLDEITLYGIFFLFPAGSSEVIAPFVRLRHGANDRRTLGARRVRNAILGYSMKQSAA